MITGADDLTSSGTIGAALALSIPLGMAGLGGLWSERSGVVNIGLEGMMILGTWGAGWAAYQWGAWAGVLVRRRRSARSAGCCTRSPRSPSASTTSSPVSPSTSSALGVTQYLSGDRVRGCAGRRRSRSPRPSPTSPRSSMPGLGDPLLTLRGQALVPGLRRRRHLPRALSPGSPCSRWSASCCSSAPICVLWRTAFGLRLRSCGESPTAAESLGRQRLPVKYAAVVASGAFAGLGGRLPRDRRRRTSTARARPPAAATSAWPP